MSRTLEWLRENIHKDFDPYQSTKDLDTLKNLAVRQQSFRNFCHQISKDFEEAEILSNTKGGAFYRAKFKTKKYKATGLPEIEERFISETPVADVLMEFIVAVRKNNQFRADVISDLQ